MSVLLGEGGFRAVVEAVQADGAGIGAKPETNTEPPAEHDAGNGKNARRGDAEA